MAKDLIIHWRTTATIAPTSLLSYLPLPCVHSCLHHAVCGSGKKPQVTNRFGKDKLHAGSSCQISSKSRSKVVEQQRAAEAESMVPQLWVVHNFVEGRPAEIRKTLSAVETVGCLKSSFSIPAVSLITIDECTTQRLLKKGIPRPVENVNKVQWHRIWHLQRNLKVDDVNLSGLLKLNVNPCRKGSNIMQMTFKVQIEVTVDKQGKQ